MNFIRSQWFALLLLHAFILQMSTILFRLASVYQSIEIGLSNVWIGVIAGAFGILPAIAGLHLGRHIDQSGVRPALVWSAILMMLSGLCLAYLPPSLGSILLGSCLMGAAQFIGVTAEQAAAAQTPQARRTSALGQLALWIGVGQMVAPLVVSYYSPTSNFPNIAAIYGFTNLFCLILVILTFFLVPPKIPTKHNPIGLIKTARSLIALRGYPLATLAALAIFTAMDLILIYLPLYAEANGISAALVGFLLSLRAVSTIISRFFFRALMQIFGRNWLVILSMASAGLSIGLLPTTDDPVLLGILLFISGFGLGLGAPLSLAWMADIVPGEILASGYALRLSVNRVGQSIFPVAAGLLIGPLGVGAIFTLIAASLLGATTLTLRRLRGDQSQKT